MNMVLGLANFKSTYSFVAILKDIKPSNVSSSKAMIFDELVSTVKSSCCTASFANFESTYFLFVTSLSLIGSLTFVSEWLLKSISPSDLTRFLFKGTFTMVFGVVKLLSKVIKS